MRTETSRLIPALLLLALLAGCHTASISDPHGRNPLYRGELSEFDVIGVPKGGRPTETEIRAARDAALPVSLPSGSSILLIQSGALIPDAPMHEALAKAYRVTPFTGIPGGKSERDPDLSARLRLAAARGGNDAIVCYWGTLESAKEEHASKSISWVPVVGMVVPDETKHMRILVRVLVVDVRTGAWTAFSSAPVTDAEASSSIGREAADAELVDRLKIAAYRAAAEDVFRRF
jgi:hypothetical protein